jgi:hypothetical protein
MPTYGTPQAGSNSSLGKNLSAVCVGDTYILFDGTETAAGGLKSVAFARATQGSGDNGITFQVIGAPAGSQVDIQSSNEDVDASYVNVETLTADSSGNANYTDTGRSPFWRAVLGSGGASPAVMPKVIAER